MAATRKGSLQGSAGSSSGTFSRNAMKWNRNTGDGTGQGSKPVAPPMSVGELGVMLLMHLCRKILLWDRLARKVAVYGIVLMFGSVLCDFFPLPKNYLWHKASPLNLYFAKFCWGWTLVVLSAYVGLTSYVYCCGVRARIRRHLSRLLVATVCWYVWTTAFVIIESATGICIGVDLERPVIDTLDRDTCLKRGLRWRGFDISGHVFLLIYCSMVIHEEAKSIKGWERIKDLIRDVDYDPDSPLESLSAEQLNLLRMSYERFRPYVRGLFVTLTILCLIWDFQVLGTVLYYHSMAQKVSGGLIAFATWFLTYRVWYFVEQSPGLPGQFAAFKFVEAAGATIETIKDRRRVLNVVTPRAKLWRNGHQAGGDVKTE